jgi:hypothetical protein
MLAASTVAWREAVARWLTGGGVDGLSKGGGGQGQDAGQGEEAVKLIERQCGMKGVEAVRRGDALR